MIIIGVVFLAIITHMSLIWLWYRKINNPSVVDVGWASGLTMSGLIYLSQAPMTLRTAILTTALILWGLRLGGYLWWSRIRPRHIDKRYTALSHTWNIEKRLGFFINFQLQGFFIALVSLSWYFTAHSIQKDLSIIDILALLLFTLALILESAADYQLQQFKKISPQAVCQEKLWRLSRHPNYFFEWLIWCSFSLFAINSANGIFALISPLTLYMIMNTITIPITERQSIISRGDLFIRYQQRTPMFFPKWPW